MALVEPVPDERAALATVDGERALLIADYHAGVEAGLRYERGVQVPSRAGDRRERLCELLRRTDAARLVVLGDLMHSIGKPGGAERGELEVLFERMPPVDVTLVKGNHDGAIESWLQEVVDGQTASPGTVDVGARSLTVLSGDGGRIESENDSIHADDTRGQAREVGVESSPDDQCAIGVCHGHSWPAPAVFSASVVCMGHEHPCVRLEDEVGGSRVEPVWLRGRLDVSWFRECGEYGDESLSDTPERPELIVLPAFNELVGGTWINLAEQSFLSPFLPDGLADGEAYLLDGTRLGPYESV